MGYTRREDRLFLCAPGVCWEGATHGNVRPLGLHRPAPSNPILRDYKVYRISMADFEAAGSRSHYRLCWGGQAHRTGVPYTVRSAIRLKDANELTTCGESTMARVPWLHRSLTSAL
jgi:hypothetical protein